MSDWFEHYGYAEVARDLLIGAYPQDAGDVAALRAAGVTQVLNLVRDAEYRAGATPASSRSARRASASTASRSWTSATCSPATSSSRRTGPTAGSTRAS